MSEDAVNNSPLDDLNVILRILKENYNKKTMELYEINESQGCDEHAYITFDDYNLTEIEKTQQSLVPAAEKIQLEAIITMLEAAIERHEQRAVDSTK